MASEEAQDPGDVLVERRTERGTGDPHERRVTVEGEVLERTSTGARFEGGEWSFDPQPWVWRRVTTLSDEQLGRVREAIAGSGFFDLDAVYRPSETSIGGSNVTWTASLDGRTHEVQLLGVPDVRVEEIEAMSATIEAVIAEAISPPA